MEMASSVISDIRLFFRHRDLFPSVNGARRLNFSGYGPLDIASPDRFGDYIMVATRSIILVKFIPAATSMTMVICTLDSPTMSTRLLACYSLTYWC
jgi:hypothetical protein